MSERKQMRGGKDIGEKCPKFDGNKDEYQEGRRKMEDWIWMWKYKKLE